MSNNLNDKRSNNLSDMMANSVINEQIEIQKEPKVNCQLLFPL